jgi:hypothetical protein
MEKDHRGEIEELKRRRRSMEGTIQRILLTFFKGENGKVRPCIETFKVMEMNDCGYRSNRDYMTLFLWINK